MCTRVFVYVCADATAHVWRSENKFGELLLSSLWVLQIELRFLSSDLIGNHHTGSRILHFKMFHELILQSHSWSGQEVHIPFGQMRRPSA